MSPATVVVNDQGRVLVPKALRDELGLTAGSELLARAEDGRLVLERRDQAVRRLQDLVRGALPPGTDLVAELASERRAASAAEDAAAGGTDGSTADRARPRRRPPRRT